MPREVPYIQIAQEHSEIKDELLASIEKVIDHGQFILGPELDEFEKIFAQLCQTSHAVGVNSGTDALILSLQALGIGDGDEVITPPNSFVASTSSVIIAGAKPVFVDVGEDYNIDPDLIEAAITPRTKAILPVHLTGRPAQMEQICQIADRHNLMIVEDAAQSVTAELNGRRVGSFGITGCFSCHPLKTLNACGDAGIITTDDIKLAEDLKVRRNLGLKNRNEAIYWGGNSRLDTLQASILITKSKHLDTWTEQRRANATLYRKYLDNIPNELFSMPCDKEGEKSVYHTFVAQADDRDNLQKHLSQNNISTAIHYPVPIHLHPVAKDLGYQKGDFPKTESQAEKIISLPIFSSTHISLPPNVDSPIDFLITFRIVYLEIILPLEVLFFIARLEKSGLLKEEDIEYVSQKIREFYQK